MILAQQIKPGSKTIQRIQNSLTPEAQAQNKSLSRVLSQNQSI
jgi:hypothetical protein